MCETADAGGVEFAGTDDGGGVGADVEKEL